ncbi:MAG TPA: PRC-barrel domain-containing protein [Nevskiaceae bacterium]
MRTKRAIRWAWIASLAVALTACASTGMQPDVATPVPAGAANGSPATSSAAPTPKPAELPPPGVSVAAYNRAVARAQALEQDQAAAQARAARLERANRDATRQLGRSERESGRRLDAAQKQNERLQQQILALRIEREAAQERVPKRQPAKPGASIPALGPVLGRNVVGRDGKQMGRIVDVLTDQLGRAGAAVIDFGGFLGVGTKKVAVAWSLLRFVPENPSQAVVLSLTRKQIEAAPAYTAPDALAKELVTSAASVAAPASAASVAGKPAAAPH